MSSIDDPEMWICIGKECGIILGDPNAVKFLITPMVTSSKTYLPNYRNSNLKKFDPCILEISLSSLLEDAIPWLLDLFSLNEELMDAIVNAFKEVIDEGFAYKLEETSFTETSNDVEIVLFDTDLPRLIGTSTTQFIRNAKLSPNDCDASQLSDFVSRKIILALYFDQPNVLPAGIPSGISRNFEKLLSKNSFVGIVISLVKKIIQYPDINLSLLWKLVDSSVICWENFPGKPSLLPGCIKEKLDKFMPRSTRLQNLDLDDNVLRIEHCDITVTKKPVAPNYFSSVFPSSVFLAMQKRTSQVNCLEDKRCMLDSTASICVALSSSMPLAERRELIDTLPRKEQISEITSVSDSPFLEAEQYSIELCRNKKVVYMLACVVRKVRPNSMQIGMAMRAINEKMVQLRTADPSKYTISVCNLLAGFIGDQCFLKPVCLVIVNDVAFLINFGPIIKLDTLRPSSVGGYMKFGLVAEQTLVNLF